MAASIELTIEDFERLPAEQAENNELVDGELIWVSSNTLKHNSIRDALIAILRPNVRGQKLGTLVGEQQYDFEGNAHGPDVSFFGVTKQTLADPVRRVQPFVPDLAVEVVSQDDTFDVLWRKKDRYRRCGTREVWIIAAESEEVFVYSEKGQSILKGQDRLRTDLIPGLSIPIEELFKQI